MRGVVEEETSETRLYKQTTAWDLPLAGLPCCRDQIPAFGKSRFGGKSVKYSPENAEGNPQMHVRRVTCTDSRGSTSKHSTARGIHWPLGWRLLHPGIVVPGSITAVYGAMHREIAPAFTS